MKGQRTGSTRGHNVDDAGDSGKNISQDLINEVTRNLSEMAQSINNDGNDNNSLFLTPEITRGVDFCS